MAPDNDRSQEIFEGRPLEPWELRRLRRLLRKQSVLEGMIDEYEQQEARKRVFGDLLSDAKGAVLLLVAVLTIVQILIALFVGRVF